MKKIINRIKGSFQYLFTGIIPFSEDISKNKKIKIDALSFLKNQEALFVCTDDIISVFKKAQNELIKNMIHDKEVVYEYFDKYYKISENDTLDSYIDSQANEIIDLYKDMLLGDKEEKTIYDFFTLGEENLTEREQIMFELFGKLATLTATSIAIMKQKEEFYLCLSSIKNGQ